MILRDPWYLLLLLLIPAAIYLERFQRPRRMPLPVLPQSAGEQSLRLRLRALPSVLRWIAAALLIVGLARPQRGLVRSYDQEKGIDIVLVVDVSTSMLAEDFTLNGVRQSRLDVVKKVVDEFIAGRPHDRLGMVVFARHPYTISPLTWDHSWLQSRLTEIEAGMVEDGTAIGAAISTAVNRLKDSKAKSRIVILLSDGANNVNTIAPDTAIELAKATGVKIYTVGAGSDGLVPYPVQDDFGRKTYHRVRIEIDEDLLRRAAERTGGRYFRAGDTGTLRAVYRQIDRLEKSEIRMPRYRQYLDLYPYFLLPALALLALELVLSHTYLRRLP